ncbi:uncharacterized protein BYT42DRAFT_611675 [Radiomyces spectabilis]|uniref:uncharacterized protein n=1 Tax=Radiomyces spectabilis TaxID=64574 RepID=UPI00221EC3AA|nr:uncharacterized protein BYT42DRAFT_611675 [Radiomyces spectabilis]KAI8388657.1 hypothetical protein BYT42DRAFT_611675 [Radiomyces spectabilis]
MDQKRTHSSELLNIPGRQKTIAKLLAEKKSQETHNEPMDTDSLPTPPPPNERKTYKVEAPSDLLSRIQAFLPQLESANKELENTDPSNLDIENVNEEDQYIEMNLGLGVYEEKRDDNDSDSDDDEEPEIVIPHTQNEGKKKGTKPNIELISKDEK